MKNRVFKVLALVIAIMILGVSICSCGFISVSDKGEETKADKNKYSVGESCDFKNKCKITYDSCSRYVSTNMFIQPDEGNEFIQLSFTVENNTDKSQYISYYFDCYADGVKCDQESIADTSLWLGDNIDAGRSVRGTIVFEVPLGAKEIEVDFKPSSSSKTKATFVVDLSKSPATTEKVTTETTTPLTDNRFDIGELCVIGSKLEITCEKCEDYISTNILQKPKEGNKFIKAYFSIKNITDKELYISYNFNCYADGVKCDEKYLLDSSMYIGEDVGAGRTVKGSIIFEVPEDASEIEIEFESTYLSSSSKKVIFVIK